MRLPLREEGFGEDGARGVEHGVSRGEVVAATIREDEEEQGDKIHPSERPEGFEGGNGEAKVESGEPERSSGKGQDELIEKEKSGEAFGDIAVMEEPEEVEVDEVMLREPEEIWR